MLPSLRYTHCMSQLTYLCSWVYGTNTACHNSHTYAPEFTVHTLSQLTYLCSWVYGTHTACHNSHTYAPEFTVNTLSPLTCPAVFSCQSSPVSLKQLWHHRPLDSSVCGCAHTLEIHGRGRVMSGKSSSINGTSSQHIVYLYLQCGGNDTYMSSSKHFNHSMCGVMEEAVIHVSTIDTIQACKQAFEGLFFFPWKFMHKCNGYTNSQLLI